MDGKNLFLKSYQTGPKNGSIHTTFNYRYQKLPNRIRKYSYHLTILQNFHLFFFFYQIIEMLAPNPPLLLNQVFRWTKQTKQQGSRRTKQTKEW